VNAWNRSTRKGQRCRVVATGNPPTTAAGRWVVRYWAPWLDRKHPNPAMPGELRWFAMIDGESVEVDGPEPFLHNGELMHPRSRTFIPARLEDNPFYGDDYRAMLQGLPEPLRSQMLYGDFDIGAEDDPWQIIPTQWVLDAQERWREGRPDVPLSALGVDVARGGDDSTVIAPLYGWWFDELEEHAGKVTDSGPKVAALVKQRWDGRAAIGLDVIGLGASPFDALSGDGVPVEGINFGAGTDAQDLTGQFRFVNVRALGYWRVREALDPDGQIRLALPDDPQLLAELTAPRWTPTQRGIKVESKDDIKKRVGGSPDRADAIVLAVLAMEPRPRYGISFVEV
jgi:hypothetical protein